MTNKMLMGLGLGLTLMLSACGGLNTPQASDQSPQLEAQSEDEEVGTVVLSHDSVSVDSVGMAQDAQAYLQQQGGVPWSELVEERVVEQACNVYVSKKYSSNRSRTETCNWPAPAGWGIFSAEVKETENFKGRGSFSHKTYAQGQNFIGSSTRLEEQKSKLRLAIDAAYKDNNFKAVAELEADYRRLEQLEQSFTSSHNWLEVTATADAGRFARSYVRVIAKVTIFRLR